MRRVLVIVWFVAMIASCKGSSLSMTSLFSFEGEIEMSTSMPGSASSMLFKMKGEKVRTETHVFGASFTSISDVSTKNIWMLDATSRTYTEVDASAMKPTTPKSTVKAINTGRHDKIVGYACDVWDVEDSATSSRSELCIATGVRMLALGLSGPFTAFASRDDGWSEVLSKGFPLRIAMLDPSGAPTMKFEATRIEKKSLPDSDFQIPAGYTKTPPI